MTHSDTDRALAIGLVGFIALVGLAAILYTLYDPAATQIFDTTSAATTNTDATGVIDEREQIWGLMLFYALFVGAFWIIARSVRESNRGGF